MQQLYANEFWAIGAKKSSTENCFSMEETNLFYEEIQQKNFTCPSSCFPLHLVTAISP